MPLHTNGTKDVFSLRLVIVTMCVLALVLCSAMAWITAHGQSAPQCLVAAVAAIIGALCAVLGIASFREATKGKPPDGKLRDTDGPPERQQR